MVGTCERTLSECCWGPFWKNGCLQTQGTRSYGPGGPFYFYVPGELWKTVILASPCIMLIDRAGGPPLNPHSFPLFFFTQFPLTN